MAFVKTSVSLPPKMAERLEKERGAVQLSPYIQNCIMGYWDTLDRAAGSLVSVFSLSEIEALLALMSYEVLRCDPAKPPPAAKGFKTLLLEINGAADFEDGAGARFTDTFLPSPSVLLEKVEGLTLAEASCLWTKIMQFWRMPQFKDRSGEETFCEIKELLNNNQEQIHEKFGVSPQVLVPF
ncbi:MAG: hypothetical protein ACYDIB_06520 [Desulfobulbia bacterium]